MKNFLKGDERVDKIARYAAERYVKNVAQLEAELRRVARDQAIERRAIAVS